MRARSGRKQLWGTKGILRGHKRMGEGSKAVLRKGNEEDLPKGLRGTNEKDAGGGPGGIGAEMRGSNNGGSKNIRYNQGL